MPRYYGPLPDWETGPLASNDVQDADKNRSVTPEIAFTKSPEAPVVPAGTPLQVDILGGKRTSMEYIMTPLEKSLSTAFREN